SPPARRPPSAPLSRCVRTGSGARPTDWPGGAWTWGASRTARAGWSGWKPGSWFGRTASRPRTGRPGASTWQVCAVSSISSMRSSALTLSEVERVAGSVLDEVERAVVGKREALELVLLGILADGHVLIEDFPGLAKTLIARSFAQALTLDFKRIQFTPDLMPSDVTGSAIFNPRSSAFEFRGGPIFTNLLLAD